MQIRTQLNDDRTHSASENVVQKVFETFDARQNESQTAVDVSEFMYIQLSAFGRDLHREHYKWSSVCSIDTLKSNCSFLIKYLLVNSLVLRQLSFALSKCFCRQSSTLRQAHTRQLLYGVVQRRTERTHKSLTIDKNFILLSLHSETSLHHQAKSTTNFYRKLYKILWNLFYEYFNNETNCHHPLYQQHQHKQDAFCDLSTKKNKSCESRNLLLFMSEMSGIDHQNQQHRSVDFKFRTLNLLYGILLIQRFVMYEFSDNHRVKHNIVVQLLEHNQMILHVTATWHYSHRHSYAKFQLRDDKSCHGIENGISTLAATSNHKLKATSQNDNDTCHQESEKLSNCYQHFHRTFRSNDSVKSHLNAILFLIILCIPLLTAASSVHNLKYSTNVVKTKYGLLRGIILRSTPTIEGYFGIPYGEFTKKLDARLTAEWASNAYRLHACRSTSRVDIVKFVRWQKFMTILMKSLFSLLNICEEGFRDKWLTHFSILLFSSLVFSNSAIGKPKVSNKFTS